MSSDGQRAKILLSYRGRPSFTSVSFFGRRGLKNQYHIMPTILSLQKAHQGVEYYELNRSWPNLSPRYFLSQSILWNWPEISSTLIQRSILPVVSPIKDYYFLPSILSSFLPSFLPPFPPSLPPSFLPSFLPSYIYISQKFITSCFAAFEWNKLHQILKIVLHLT